MGRVSLSEIWSPIFIDDVSVCIEILNHSENSKSFIQHLALPLYFLKIAKYGIYILCRVSVKNILRFGKWNRICLNWLTLTNLPFSIHWEWAAIYWLKIGRHFVHQDFQERKNILFLPKKYFAVFARYILKATEIVHHSPTKNLIIL